MIIGQEKIKAILDNIIISSKQRQVASPHILFSGKSGFGKNTLAYHITERLDKELFHLIGAKTKSVDLLKILLKTQPKDIIFIDEIHTLDIKTTEFLYPILEENKVITEKRTVTIDPRTFIGATTNIGLVAKPLINRFPYVLTLEDYTAEERVEIVKLKAAQFNITIDSSAVLLLAESGKGCPRLINNLLVATRDYCVANKTKATLDVTERILELLDIEDGLDKLDRRYLNLLGNKPTSLNTLASNLGVHPDTVRETIEPHLLEKGLIKIVSRGRVESGWEEGDNFLEDLLNI